MPSKMARPTEDYVRIEKLMDAFGVPLLRVSAAWDRPKPEEMDSYARRISSAAGDLLDALRFDIESERDERAFSKIKPKMRNLFKMLEEYKRVKSGDELTALVKSHRTKSQTAYDKFREYQNQVLGFIQHFDTEIEGTLRVGPYTVILHTAHRSDWTPDMVEKLREILKRAERAIRRAGLQKIVGGKIYAFPSQSLPLAAGSGNTSAWYRPRSDTMALAVGREIDRVVKSLVHETGHRAYYKLIEGRSHEAWNQFFDDNHGTPPNIDRIIADWERWAATSKDYFARNYGRYLEYYLIEARKTNPDNAMWLRLLKEKLPIKEEYREDGSPKKNSVPGLDQLIAKKNEAKVFLYPVTAYSGLNAEELYAETFAKICLEGPSKVPEILRQAFYNILPDFRRASDFRAQVVKMAQKYPELRRHLVPLLS